MTRASDREPVPLSEALAALERELGLAGASGFRLLVERWSDVVGADIAAHATLESIRDGVAVVGVDSAPWATQLRYLATAVVERVSEIAGPAVVRELRVRVRPETGT